jgi:hypothetical protein
MTALYPLHPSTHLFIKYFLSVSYVPGPVMTHREKMSKVWILENVSLIRKAKKKKKKKKTTKEKLKEIENWGHA